MIFIYVPCQSVDVAKTIAKILIEKRMAGTVDVLPAHLFRQENGGVAETSGSVMVIKTIDKHVQDIEDVVREHHQNGIPCIATISLYRLNRDFKDWLINATI